ncbi:MAG: hypothetical protein ABIH25_04265 [Candidatus Woesearchaeota archaeon]
MNLKSAIIWVIAGIGLFLLGSGLSGFAIFEQTCCLPSPFCEEVVECEFAKEPPNEREVVSKNMEFVILGLLMFILLFILYENTRFFKE